MSPQRGCESRERPGTVCENKIQKKKKFEKKIQKKLDSESQGLITAEQFCLKHFKILKKVFKSLILKKI